MPAPFSLPTLLILEYFAEYEHFWFVVLSATTVPLISAIIWRTLLLNIYNITLMKLGYSSDESPSAWHSLSHDEEHFFTQLSVLTDDNEWLRCDLLESFKESPSGPAVFGPSGDIGMYVTHTQLIGKEVKELQTTIDSDYGDRMTFIPKERIKRVNFRRIR